MDADALETFAAVVRAGGFTRAAAELQTVQSNVTRRIRLLESELGIQLFERHARGVRLTTAGQELLPYADRVAALVLEARQAAIGAETAAPLPPRLTVGAGERLIGFRLPAIVTAFAAANPAVALALEPGIDEELVAGVLAGRLDAALVSRTAPQWELEASALFVDELAIVTAPSANPLHALAANDLLLLRHDAGLRSRIESILASRQLQTLRRRELGSFEAIVALIAAGMGAALLPRAMVASAAAAGRVAIHALRPAERPLETMLIRRRDRGETAALRAFIEIARRNA
jgi:DNA-binding transcriptional LysR family regulator